MSKISGESSSSAIACKLSSDRFFPINFVSLRLTALGSPRMSSCALSGQIDYHFFIFSLQTSRGADVSKYINFIHPPPVSLKLVSSSTEEKKSREKRVCHMGLVPYSGAILEGLLAPYWKAYWRHIGSHIRRHIDQALTRVSFFFINPMRCNPVLIAY